MAIVIKRKVSLAFLGADYKDAYLTFQSIPAVDFDEVTAKIKEIEDKQDGSLSFILGILKQYFIEGSFPGLDTVTKDDLDGLDPVATVNCFKVFTGQELDPKAEIPSTSTSTTVESPPENS